MISLRTFERFVCNFSGKLVPDKQLQKLTTERQKEKLLNVFEKRSIQSVFDLGFEILLIVLYVQKFEVLFCFLVKLIVRRNQ